MQTRSEQNVKSERDEIQKRTGRTFEKLFEEREKRVTDAVQLKTPDRVPVCLRGGYFPVKYAGLSQAAPFYDPAAYKQAVTKMLLDFDADVFTMVSNRFVSGFALEQLGSTQLMWPGGSLRSDQSAQFVETEVMKENEYDLFMTDPGDFILRCYLPRTWKALEPLSRLPSLQSLIGHSSMATQSSAFKKAEVIQVFETISKAGEEQVKFDQIGKDISETVGVPELSYSGGIGNQPFDVFASHLRGLRGVMVDMFKQPDKLLAACDKIVEWRLAKAPPADPKERGKRRVGASSNHFSNDEFLTRKQFETFCWPSWKKAFLATIDLGYIPVTFLEGRTDNQIEYFLELPKAKAVVAFEKVDMARAKAVLGGHLCIAGNVPGSLLWGGSPQETEEYCKNLIKVCAKGGGFILDSGCSLDDAKPANVKAMIDSVKKYGRY